MALILNMPMQDNAATSFVDDISASNNNGSLQVTNTNAMSAAGPGGSLPLSLDFAVSSANSDYVTLPSPAGFGASCTFQFFAKRPTHAGLCHIAGFRLKVDGTTITIVDDLDGFASRLHGVADLTAWHHFAITQNASRTCTLYVDGALVGALSPNLSAVANVVTFGDDGFGETFFNFRLAGVKLYDEIRTQPQIQVDHLSGLSAPHSTLGIKISTGL